MHNPIGTEGGSLLFNQRNGFLLSCIQPQVCAVPRFWESRPVWQSVVQGLRKGVGLVYPGIMARTLYELERTP